MTLGRHLNLSLKQRRRTPVPPDSLNFYLKGKMGLCGRGRERTWTKVAHLPVASQSHLLSSMLESKLCGAVAHTCAGLTCWDWHLVLVGATSEACTCLPCLCVCFWLGAGSSPSDSGEDGLEVCVSKSPQDLFLQTIGEVRQGGQHPPFSDRMAGEAQPFWAASNPISMAASHPPLLSVCRAASMAGSCGLLIKKSRLVEVSAF